MLLEDSSCTHWFSDITHLNKDWYICDDRVKCVMLTTFSFSDLFGLHWYSIFAILGTCNIRSSMGIVEKFCLSRHYYRLGKDILGEQVFFFLWLVRPILISNFCHFRYIQYTEFAGYCWEILLIKALLQAWRGYIRVIWFHWCIFKMFQGEFLFF